VAMPQIEVGPGLWVDEDALDWTKSTPDKPARGHDKVLIRSKYQQEKERYFTSIPTGPSLEGPRHGVNSEQAMTSGQVRFLEQTFGLARDPYQDFRKLSEVGKDWSVPVNEGLGVRPRRRKEILAWGVSHDGEGKGAYLRTSYSRLPQQRDETPVPGTSAQQIGFYAYPGLGKPMPLHEPRQSADGVKNFFKRTQLHQLRRPDLGLAREASTLFKQQAPVGAAKKSPLT